MQLRVLANWLYAIQVFLNMDENCNNLMGIPDGHCDRFMVMQDGNFKTSCLSNTNCNIAVMTFYVVQSGSTILIDNQRNVKIGYCQKHANGNTTKYYLAAAEEDNFEVSATEDFDKGVLFNMTTNATSFEIKLFDPISQRHLQAMSIPNCGVGELALVDSNDPERNNSTLKVTKEVINRHVACC